MSSNCMRICYLRRWRERIEMLIRRLKEHSIELIDIEPIEAELLRQVPGVCENGGDSRSEARLFSSPADSSTVCMASELWPGPNP